MNRAAKASQIAHPLSTWVERNDDKLICHHTLLHNARMLGVILDRDKEGRTNTKNEVGYKVIDSFIICFV